MKLRLFFILIFIAFTLNVSAQKKEFVGYKHKGVVVGETLPNGAKDLGGGLLSNENFGVSRFSKGKKHYLWLEKITGRDTFSNSMRSRKIRSFCFPTVRPARLKAMKTSTRSYSPSSTRKKRPTKF
jgi:hypothetical protein